MLEPRGWKQPLWMQTMKWMQMLMGIRRLSSMGPMDTHSLWQRCSMLIPPSVAASVCCPAWAALLTWVHNTSYMTDGCSIYAGTWSIGVGKCPAGSRKRGSFYWTSTAAR